MKKVINIVALALVVAAGANAQTIYDGVKFTQKDLNGTARFVGMGGAMSALGGDISTMGTNPAGIGIYRSNDVMGTFGFSSYGMESNYDGVKSNIDKSRWSFDNIGFVFSSKIGNQTPLRYVNFGFNYTRSRSFDKYMSMEGLINLGANNAILSQTNQMANQANKMLKYYGEYIDQLDKDKVNLFTDSKVSWLAATGWNAFLYNPSDDGFTGYLPQPYSWFDSREKGGINQYDFNISFNVNDRVYLGVTVGAYDVNYSKTSTYGEDFGNYIDPTTQINYGPQSYEMTTENRIEGSGVDFKFGAIVRPFEDSPFRMGVAIHTPTFYNLKMKTNVRAVSDIFSPEDKKMYSYIVDSYDFTDNVDYGYDFRLRTPWKYNFSLGYTYGSSFAIGAEYEYQDYTGMRFSYTDGEDFEWENSTAKEMLTGVNTFRIGAELKVIPEFAFRLGYNYTSAAFKNTAFKDLSPNSINTDTDYANVKASNDYTIGIGYRGKTFYTDLAYMYNTYKEDFFAFEDANLIKTKVTNTRSKVMLTLGMRF